MRSRTIAPLVLILLAMAVSLFMSCVVFRDAPLTTDEHAYVFQANCFADGVVARPLPEPVRMFPHEMMIMDEEAGWLSRYPPAHAAWLVPGALVGNPRLMVALAGGCSLVLLMLLGRTLGFPALLIPGLAVLSPYFFFMHGTLLSHTSGLVAVSLLLFSYIRWKTAGKNLWALAAGLAWSWFFLNRTWTGALIAVPFGIDALADLARQRNRQTLIGTSLFAAAAGLGPVLFFLYNYLAIGDPWTPTYLFYQPADGLGFGPRPPGSIPAEHTLQLGLRALIDNLLLLDRWLYGFPGSLALVLFLALRYRNRRWMGLLLATPLMVYGGYVLFWFEGIRLVGPVYYYETLPFLLVLAGFGVRGLQQELSRLSRPRRRLYQGILAVVIGCGALVFSWQQGQFLRDWQRGSGAYHQLLRSAPDNSLVMVDKVAGMNYVTRGMAYNPHGEASDPLVVHRGKLPDAFLATAYPDRQVYRLVARANDDFALEPYRPGSPLIYGWRIVDAKARTGSVLPRPDVDSEPVRWAREDLHRPDWLSYGIHCWLSRGQYLLRVYLRTSGVSAKKPLVVDVASAGGENILARYLIAEDQGPTVEIPFTVDRRMRVEPRLFFQGSGTIKARKMEIVRMDGAVGAERG